MRLVGSSPRASSTKSISLTSFEPSVSNHFLFKLTRLTAFASLRTRSSSALLILRCFANSSCVGRRPKRSESSLFASDNLRARERTKRGTQSILRSSSSIAPRMRGTQYVSNLTPRAGSNASIASINPKIPDETKSSKSTSSGRRDQTRSP